MLEQFAATFEKRTLMSRRQSTLKLKEMISRMNLSSASGGGAHVAEMKRNIFRGALQPTGKKAPGDYGKYKAPSESIPHISH